MNLHYFWPITRLIGDQPIAGVKKYKLLVMWLDDNMKRATNTEFIIIKEAKRLHFLRILYNLLTILTIYSEFDLLDTSDYSHDNPIDDSGASDDIFKRDKNIQRFDMKNLVTVVS